MTKNKKPSFCYDQIIWKKIFIKVNAFIKSQAFKIITTKLSEDVLLQ